jgi:cell division septation protein DedD
MSDNKRNSDANNDNNNINRIDKLRLNSNSSPVTDISQQPLEVERHQEEQEEEEAETQRNHVSPSITEATITSIANSLANASNTRLTTSYKQIRVNCKLEFNFFCLN